MTGSRRNLFWLKLRGFVIPAIVVLAVLLFGCHVHLHIGERHFGELPPDEAALERIDRIFAGETDGTSEETQEE